MVPEARRPKSRCWLIGFLVRALFLAYRGPPSLCHLTWPFPLGQGRVEREPFGNSSYKDTNPVGSESHPFYFIYP